MIIDDQIRDGINRQAAKISALSSNKIGKYEYLTGEEILPSNEKQIIQQARFTYSPLGKAFEKQKNKQKKQKQLRVNVMTNFQCKKKLIINY